MSRGVLSLALAQALALLAALVSAACYARWLRPDQLAVWAMALAGARAGLLLLDGGLKTALVRRDDLPGAATLRRLGLGCAGAAAVLTALAVLAALALQAAGRVDVGGAWLLAAYPAAYLLAYPPLLTALARLERAQQFGPVGRAEGASVVLEFALPALLIAAGLAWWTAFAVAVLAARLLRTAWIVAAARGLADAAPGAGAAPVRQLLAEGAGVQVVAGVSMLRDQMHLWLLAPLFGAVWAGVYSLALSACALVAQVGAATAARVALPALRASASAAQWPAVLAQTRRLAIATLPPLALLPAWVAHADSHWWGGQWQEAAALMPWLALRMLPGLAATTLGAWLLLARTPWQAACVHGAWLLAELALALPAVLLLGAPGLAVAGAFSAWAGVLLFLAAVAPAAPLWPRFGDLLQALLLRPSLAIALALAAWAWARPNDLFLASAGMVLAWWSEPTLRRWAQELMRPQPAVAARRPQAL
ncbi:membrane hypothetical protein [Rubrivivax sp. A210]|uniref:oligosaccharide flippase family protein n=1 Tax=Rubrivivax sp. A210 TaxID=2772301 RepID=UPI00191B0FEE|nr:oligosaccharide flippase family protein [Rubrivivax sp. A210]CAD5371275.1 membrane hypothetical protein [Rubrivivax sp. A210]